MFSVLVNIFLNKLAITVFRKETGLLIGGGVFVRLPNY